MFEHILLLRMRAQKRHLMVLIVHDNSFGWPLSITQAG